MNFDFTFLRVGLYIGIWWTVVASALLFTTIVGYRRRPDDLGFRILLYCLIFGVGLLVLSGLGLLIVRGLGLR